MFNLNQALTDLTVIYNEWDLKSSRSTNIKGFLDKLHTSANHLVATSLENFSLKSYSKQKKVAVIAAANLEIFCKKIKNFKNQWNYRTHRVPSKESNQKSIGELLSKSPELKGTIRRICKIIEDNLKLAASLENNLKLVAALRAVKSGSTSTLDAETIKLTEAARRKPSDPQTATPRVFKKPQKITKSNAAEIAITGVPKGFTKYGAAYNESGTAWIGYENSIKLVFYWAQKGQTLVEEEEAKIIVENGKMIARSVIRNLIVEMQISQNAAAAATANYAKINGSPATLI